MLRLRLRLRAVRGARIRTSHLGVTRDWSVSNLINNLDLTRLFHFFRGLCCPILLLLLFEEYFLVVAGADYLLHHDEVVLLLG